MQSPNGWSVEGLRRGSLAKGGSPVGGVLLRQGSDGPRTFLVTRCVEFEFSVTAATAREAAGLAEVLWRDGDYEDFASTFVEVTDPLYQVVTGFSPS